MKRQIHPWHKTAFEAPRGWWGCTQNIYDFPNSIEIYIRHADSYALQNNSFFLYPGKRFTKFLGHGGDFLSTENTMEHFRDDWYPKLFDRNHFEGWSAAGSKTLLQRSQERLEKILTEHRPAPLSPEVQQRIDQVLNRP